LNSETTVDTPKNLRGFCATFCNKHTEHWPPDEHELAMEFVAYFGLPPLPKLDDYRALALRLAIEVSVAPLPAGLRGYNSRYKERNLIVIERLEGRAGRSGIPEHTFLHELRELVEYEFRRQQRPTASGQELESRAEWFATAVRALAPMPLLKELGESALEMKGAWRFLAVGLVVGFGVLHVLFSFLLPHHEDYLRKLN
jgi:hypothetical protein